jgi:hypothetical protein
VSLVPSPETERHCQAGDSGAVLYREVVARQLPDKFPAAVPSVMRSNYAVDRQVMQKMITAASPRVVRYEPHSQCL